MIWYNGRLCHAPKQHWIRFLPRLIPSEPLVLPGAMGRIMWGKGVGAAPGPCSEDRQESHWQYTPLPGDARLSLGVVFRNAACAPSCPSRLSPLCSDTYCGDNGLLNRSIVRWVHPLVKEMLNHRPEQALMLARVHSSGTTPRHRHQRPALPQKTGPQLPSAFRDAARWFGRLAFQLTTDRIIQASWAYALGKQRLDSTHIMSPSLHHPAGPVAVHDTVVPAGLAWEHPELSCGSVGLLGRS